MKTSILLILSSLSLLACGSSSSSLTKRGESPCGLTGGGVVETWCDDAGKCEFRAGGMTFGCNALGSSECTTAATNAARACTGGDAGMSSTASTPGGSTPGAFSAQGPATPCPNGNGSIQTFCDAQANCEIRVNGQVFSCSGANCQDAAQRAAAACTR